MLFSGEEVNKLAKVMSGGEKVRAMLSKMMLNKGNVLLLDEPTNFLDKEHVEWLSDFLKNFKTPIDKTVLTCYCTNRLIQRHKEGASNE